MCRGLILFLLLVACGKETPTNPTTDNGTFSAAIDGAPWSASSTLVAGWAPGLLVIQGSDGAITLDIRAYGSDIGTYTVGSATFLATAVVTTGGTANWASTITGATGTITLTTLFAHEAIGTFSFSLPPSATGSATGTKVITAGNFDVTY